MVTRSRSAHVTNHRIITEQQTEISFVDFSKQRQERRTTQRVVRSERSADFEKKRDLCLLFCCDSMISHTGRACERGRVTMVKQGMLTRVDAPDPSTFPCAFTRMLCLCNEELLP